VGFPAERHLGSTFSGNASFHYDAALANLTDHAPFGPDTWRLITSGTEKKTKAALFK
jgi:hypothetical protein